MGSQINVNYRVGRFGGTSEPLFDLTQDHIPRVRDIVRHDGQFYRVRDIVWRHSNEHSGKVDHVYVEIYLRNA